MAAAAVITGELEAVPISDCPLSTRTEVMTLAAAAAAAAVVVARGATAVKVVVVVAVVQRRRGRLGRRARPS